MGSISVDQIRPEDLIVPLFIIDIIAKAEKDRDYSTHKTLFSYGKRAVENIANLEKVPVIGAALIVGAPKLGHATGGIARIFFDMAMRHLNNIKKTDILSSIIIKL